MSAFKRACAVAAVAMLMAGQPASASSILIDFEHLPGADGVLGTLDDTPTGGREIEALSDQFAALGVTFSQGSLFNYQLFSVDGSSHFISSSYPIASFSVPVYGISIQSKSFWDATLTAYDADGKVLAAQTLKGNGQFNLGTISVSSARAISSFSVMPDNPNHILNLDNLSLETSPAPVPEPFSYVMLAAGGLLLAGQRRRACRLKQA